jgi:hypothetical protein
MEKFLVLYLAPVAAIEDMVKNMKPEQGDAGKRDWANWMKEHADSFVDTGGPVGKTKRATPDGTTDVTNEVMGYSIVQAESHEAAAKMLESVPNVPGGYVDVMRIGSMG